MAAKISVNVVRGSRLIELTVDDHDPQNARRLAQQIIDEFFRQSRGQKSRDVTAARDQLLAEAKRVGAEFKTSEEKLEAYRVKYNAVSLQERQNIVVERLRELNQQVATAKSARLTSESDYNQVVRLADSDPERLLGLHAVADQPDIIDLRKQVAQGEAHVVMLSQRYGDLHPTMIQAKSQLQEMRAALRVGIQKAVSQIEQSYAATKATEEALEAALKTQEQAALDLDRIAIPYHSLEREKEADGATYQKILDQLNQLDVAHGLTSDSDVNGVDIRVVAAPLVPVHPTGPRQELLLALSAATGLFLGCGLALVTRALDNTVSSVDNAEATLGLPVLTTVPRSRHHRLTGKPLVLRYPASIQAEAFRSLRTSLSLQESTEGRRCVLFTSALPGEGKSFCSVNCAASFAQQGLRTLLIDADLRRPSLLRIFGDPNGKPELSACLRDAALFPAAVQRTRFEHLYRLGDWRHHAGSAELLARDGMREVLARTTAEFERVVIDTAPLMAVSDTLHIAPHVSTVCVVVYAGRTPRRMTLRALKLLEEVAKRGATGLVLNKTTSRSAAGHYYYYNS